MKRLVLLILLIATPTIAAGFEVSGWIPYWKVKEGAADARRHLDQLTEINPFSYVVNEEGKIKDLAKMKQSAWTKLIKEAKRQKVRVVPTVMWSDGAKTHAILSNQESRNKLVREIANLVKKQKYDGIDIDFEAKKAETKDYFSAFLTELKIALGNKQLSCTIESRTPPESLYRTMPVKLEFANDLPTIARVCDQVKVMTYDQRNADIKLNDAKGFLPYMPVSDVDWVRKVMVHMAQVIPKEKLVVGIPTYGHEYELRGSNERYTYKRLWSLNPEYAWETARLYNIAPGRLSSGEAGFNYIATSSPRGTLNFITWSDAEAVRQKVDLARELGLGGVAIFKIDGGEDARLWDLF